MEKSLIKVDFQALKNLEKVDTLTLEQCFFLIRNKEIMSKVSEELMKRKDLTMFQLVESTSQKKKEIIFNPKKEFYIEFFKKVACGDIKPYFYFDWKAIEKEIGKTFSKDLFNIDYKEVEVKPKKYLKQKQGVIEYGK